MNPYIRQMQQPQELGGLNPVFQNFGQQQANQQAALAQQNQLVNQASQTQSGGMSPMALAQALRKNDPNQQSLASKMGVYAKSIPLMMQYGSENVYGGFGQGQVPTMTTGMD
jgi:trimethylamine:corrinoid methyltransferase-like protein